MSKKLNWINIWTALEKQGFTFHRVYQDRLMIEVNRRVAALLRGKIKKEPRK